MELALLLPGGVWRLRQILVGVVLADVRLRGHVGVFLQQILALLPVFLGRPEQRLALGVLGVVIDMRAVDLQQRDFRVEGLGAA